MKGTIILNLLLFLLVIAQAQDADRNAALNTIAKRQYNTTKIIDKAPIIDGYLNDPAWEQVEWSTGFTQRQPDDGADPTLETSFKILYDDENIYIGFRCHDPEPDKIVSRMSRRDGFEGDWVEINIDSYNDKRSAFSFTSSVSGVKGDEFISNNGGNWDSSWNPIWYLKTSIDPEGWVAELRIPLSQLRYGNKEEQVWGFQVQRRDFRNSSMSCWQYIPQNTGTWVSDFGELHGIKGIKPQKQVEIQPYVVGKVESYEEEEGNPYATGFDRNLSGGIDGKIGVTSDFVLDFTVNPDFGQVEADPSVVRLDGFQNFFREQRPFFVENNNIFDFRITGSDAGGDYDSDNLFYSRRIGSSPHHYPDLDDNQYADVPENTSILGAAKFSGKNKNGLSIGILESVTAEERATISTGDEETEEIVEPLTNYFVTRIQQDFDGGNTVIGGILTGVNRRLNETNLDWLHRSAYTGGVDFVHKWKKQTWVASGNLIFSHVEGTPEAIYETQTSFDHYFQRPNAKHLNIDDNATSLSGTGGTLKIAEYGGNLKFQTGVTWRSPNLQLNDIGFMNTSDEINHFFWGGYRINKPFSIFRNLGLNYNHWSRWDFGGNHLYQAFNANFWTELKNFYNVGAGVTKELKDISNKGLFGGPTLRKSPGFAFWAFVNTDYRKKLRFRFHTFHGWGTEKDQARTVRSYGYNIGITYQPVNSFNISVQPSFNHFERLMQYVTTVTPSDNDQYIVSSIDQNTFSMTIRANYNITPNLTIQYYGQPFITQVQYFDFKEITNPMADRFHQRFVPIHNHQVTYDELNETYFVDRDGRVGTDYSFGKPDFSFIQFRSNLVARWEYVPGSELFLVWSQGVTNSGDPNEELIPSLTDNVFQEKGRNIFLVKWTYRFLL